MYQELQELLTHFVEFRSDSPLIDRRHDLHDRVIDCHGHDSGVISYGMVLITRKPKIMAHCAALIACGDGGRRHLACLTITIRVACYMP